MIGGLENRFGPVRDVDHVIIGSPVYFGAFPRRLMKWLRRNRGELAGKPVSVFIVSMNAAGTNEESHRRDDETLRKFIRQARLQPLFAESFARTIQNLEDGMRRGGERRRDAVSSSP